MQGRYKIQISNVGKEAEAILDDSKRRSSFVKEAIEFYLANRGNRDVGSQGKQVDEGVLQSLTATVQIQATTIQAQQEEIAKLKAMQIEHPIQSVSSALVHIEELPEEEEIQQVIEEVVVEEVKPQESSLFTFVEEENEEEKDLEEDILNSITNMLGM